MERDNLEVDQRLREIKVIPTDYELEVKKNELDSLCNSLQS